jgi:hypothetical protein
MPVIVFADGSKLAYFGGLSSRGLNSDGKNRLSGLTVKTDSAGIVREYAFTDETKERANLVDWIPFANRILETNAVRRFIQGYHSASNTLYMDRNPVNLPYLGSFGFDGKWYQIILSIILLFSLMSTVLAPAILLPVFISMLLFMSRRSFPSERIFRIGKIFGFIVFLILAFYAALILDASYVVIMALGSFIFCYFSFIPEFKNELDGLRCNTCSEWDTIYFTKELEKTEYKDTTTWKYKSGREEKQVSYRTLTKRLYQCNVCGEEIIAPSWK